MAFTDIDTDTLYSRMFSAAHSDNKQVWERVRTVLKVELKGLARQIKELGKAVAAGDISGNEAAAVMRLQADHSALIVAAFTSAKLPEAEAAISTSLAAIRDSVNAAVGFSLV